MSTMEDSLSPAELPRRITYRTFSAEVLVEILSYLRDDNDTLHSCSLASRTMLGPSRTQLFHTITLSGRGTSLSRFEDFATFIASAPSIAALVRVLVLRSSTGASPRQLPSIPAILFASIVKDMSGLLVLKLRDIWSVGQKNVLEPGSEVTMPNLKTLDVALPWYLTNSPYVFYMLSLTPRLKTLKIAGGDWSSSFLEQRATLGDFADGLELDEFKFVSLPSGLHLFQFAEHVPCLHRLRSLECAISLHESMLGPLGAFLHSYGETLQDLSLRIIQTSSDIHIQNACKALSLSSCTSLRQLRIWISCSHPYRRAVLEFLPTLLAHVPVQDTREITCVMPFITPRHEHQLGNVMEWHRLQDTLLQFPHLSRFCVVQMATHWPLESQIDDKTKQASPRMVNWVKGLLNILDVKGILFFS